MEKDIWKILYDKAREVQNAREVSPFIEAGGVAAAILTKSGNIYVGVCIDTASTLGMCAERFQEENHEKQGYFYFSDYMDYYIIVLVLGRKYCNRYHMAMCRSH